MNRNIITTKELNNNLTVSVLLSQKLSNTQQARNFIINTPTGSGKTFAIQEVLFPRIYSEQSHLLYVVNRNAVLGQFSASLKEYSQRHPDMAEFLYQHVTCMTYQRLETVLRTCESVAGTIYDTRRYNYICLDEVHYFWHDSSFNPYTDLSYQHLLFNQTGFRFLMSASLTDEMIRKLQADLYNHTREASYRGPIHAQPNPEKYISSRCPIIDNLKPDYSNLHVNAFNVMDDIPELIKKCQGKTIIFVSSIAEGNRIADLFKSNNIADFKVLTSKYRTEPDMNETMHSIALRDTFDCSILITTTVIDNGVNLKDNSIKNLFILTHSKIDLIQCLGRRRTSKDEQLNLYLCRRNLKYFTDLKRCLDSVWHSYSIIARYKSAVERLHIYHDNPEYQGDFNKIGYYINAVNKLCCIPQAQCPHFHSGCHYRGNCNYQYREFRQEFHINPLSVENITAQIASINNIIERFNIDGADAFLLEQLQWLSSDGALIPHSDTGRVALIQALNDELQKHICQKMSSRQFTDFLARPEISSLCRKLCTPRIPLSKPVTKHTAIDLLSSEAALAYEIKQTEEKSKKYYLLVPKESTI
ncbi:MAG: DEAD/DEAH box helicase family protein [Butyribacter sp.]|nr:DEAD/DEAH box helicase family protein [bacterium]MDY3854498.1 DEAD/DEAH box helicase family protein [Butyribacter sp.]